MLSTLIPSVVHRSALTSGSNRSTRRHNSTSSRVHHVSFSEPSMTCDQFSEAERASSKRRSRRGVIRGNCARAATYPHSGVGELMRSRRIVASARCPASVGGRLQHARRAHRRFLQDQRSFGQPDGCGGIPCPTADRFPCRRQAVRAQTQTMARIRRHDRAG